MEELMTYVPTLSNKHRLDNPFNHTGRLKQQLCEIGVVNRFISSSTHIQLFHKEK